MSKEVIKKARKKPIEVEFIQWTGGNHRPMFDFLTESENEIISSSGHNFLIDHSRIQGGLCIKTSEGIMHASIGDFIIKEPFDKDRKFYPCKKEIFEKTYDIL